MRILDFECVVSADGKSRAASSQENGSACYVEGWGLVAHGALPPAVLDWLLRPRLHEAWESGHSSHPFENGPYEGEPPNKEQDPS